MASVIGIIVRMADSVAKHYGCRLKYSEGDSIINYIGPEECKQFIVNESNSFLSSIGFPLIPDNNVIFLSECIIVKEDIHEELPLDDK